MGSDSRDLYPGRSRLYLSGFGGTLSGRESPGQLEDERGEATLGFGFGYRKNRHLVLEGEILLLDRNYAAPPQDEFFLIGYSERMEVEAAGVTFGVRGVWPLRRVEPFVGAGMGLYRSEAKVPGLAFVIPIEESDTDLGIGFHLVTGFDLILTREWSLGLEFRMYELEADFDGLSHGKVDIGGESVAIALRYFP
jgi:opacity protein-like surface antigen